MYTANTETDEPKDKATDLLPKAGETRAGWLARAFGALLAWFKKPRSRIGFLLLATAALLQGCATAAWHNYQVAEAEASERAQIEAGLIPLVKTNGDIVRENWAGYLVGLGIDFGVGYCAWKYIDRDDKQTVYAPTYNDNRTLPPAPVAEEPQGTATEE